jgi:hypothetical protein
MALTIEQWALRWNIPAQAVAELLALPIPTAEIESDPAIRSESGVQAQLRVEAPRLSAHLWRNNSGAMTDAETGNHVRFGLGNDSKKINDVFKSSDLIGITPVEWHGRLFGVFTAVEVKKPGWTKPSSQRDRAQKNFLDTITRCGGIATFATHVEQYQSLVQHFRGNR